MKRERLFLENPVQKIEVSKKNLTIAPAQKKRIEHSVTKTIEKKEVQEKSPQFTLVSFFVEKDRLFFEGTLQEKTGNERFEVLVDDEKIYEKDSLEEIIKEEILLTKIPNGLHKFTVRVFHENQLLLEENKEFVLKKYEYQLTLSYPKSTNYYQNLWIEGNYESEKEVKLKVTLGNHSYRFTENNFENGHFTKEISLKNFEVGTYDFHLWLEDLETKEILIEEIVPITVSSKEIDLELELPEDPLPYSFLLKGTYQSKDPVILQAFFDDQEITFHQVENTFESLFDLKEFEDGTHMFSFYLYHAESKELLLKQEKKVTLQKYQIKMDINPLSESYDTSVTIEGTIESNIEEVVDLYLKGEKISEIPIQVGKTNFSFPYSLENQEDGNITFLFQVAFEDFLWEEEVEVKVSHKKEFFGIDISSYQGNIDFTKVKNAGVDFVMIRVGYRGYKYPNLVEDEKFYANAKGAINAGIPIGLYFFSHAITEEEAIEEANFVLNKINEYQLKITYPIAFDSEFSGAPNNSGRADNLSKIKRTKVAKAFLNTIRQNQYVPMIYASKYFFYDNLSRTSLTDYDTWLAHYFNGAPQIKSDYNGKYQMWQYSSSGTIPGIQGPVDLNISYKKY